MFQNIKVDIIYFDTSTDFELEFNLSGCCRMRLLTDKTDDNKNFIHMLARGVSRSKVIIIIGKLFGENGIISLSSQAIAKTLSVIDNKAFGIESEQEIKIISNSTPLVSADGYFGGCIIESGPQTMILLTENKNIRKNIMNTLIHPYITELSVLEMRNINSSKTAKNIVSEDSKAEPSEKESSPVSDEQPEDSAQNEIADDKSAISEDLYEPTEEIPNESENDVSLDGNMEFTEYQSIGENYVFSEDNYNIENNGINEAVDEKLPSQEETSASEQSDYFIFDESEDFKHKNTKKEFNINSVIFIIAVVMLVILAILCFTVFYVPISSGSSPAEFIGETFGNLFGHSLH